jgi:hypothetical protein
MTSSGEAESVVFQAVLIDAPGEDDCPGDSVGRCEGDFSGEEDWDEEEEGEEEQGEQGTLSLEFRVELERQQIPAQHGKRKASRRGKRNLKKPRVDEVEEDWLVEEGGEEEYEFASDNPNVQQGAVVMDTSTAQQLQEEKTRLQISTDAEFARTGVMDYHAGSAEEDIKRGRGAVK